MVRRPPTSTRSVSLFPVTTPCRSGSQASRGARASYQAYGMASPQSSAGEVNVGGRQITGVAAGSADTDAVNVGQLRAVRSEEHTSELQSLMRISYAVFCLTKKKDQRGREHV